MNANDPELCSVTRRPSPPHKTHRKRGWTARRCVTERAVAGRPHECPFRKGGRPPFRTPSQGNRTGQTCDAGHLVTSEEDELDALEAVSTFK